MLANHVSINGYAGPQIRGTVKYSPSSNAGHFERAFYVTSVVESGALYGGILAGDGTTMTAGLHQAILTYPKELMTEDFNAGDDIGSLADLLARVSKLPPFHEYKALELAFATNGWKLGSDGLFRYIKAKTFPLGGKQISVKPGDLVYGADLRNTITPPNGKVPRTGALWQQSASWAILFHKVFVHPSTYALQIEYGLEHTAKTCKAQRLANKQTVATYIYGNSQEKNPFFLCPEADLAMTVYWSHSVNAPGAALQRLNQAIAQSGFLGYTHSDLPMQAKFGKALLKSLGTSTYGRWNFSEKNGRWARTRMFCQSTNYWDKKLFQPGGVMPQEF